MSIQLDYKNKNLIQTLSKLKRILWVEEYASCFKQRLAEGYSLIHTPRRILSNADIRSEELVSLFGDNKSLSIKQAENLFKESLFTDLCILGILKIISKTKKIISILRIVPINQFLIFIPFREFSDPPVYIGADSLTFFRHINSLRRPKDILDLATGSGFQLFGLPWQGDDTSMIGLDINPNAIKIALLNSKINETPWMNFYEKDITKNFSNINQKFDLIIGNPPIIPTPEKISTRLQGMIHADGGKDGFKVVRQLIPNALDVLKKNGSIQLIISSLGSDRPSIIEELKELISQESLTIQFVVLKKIPVELDSYYRGQKNLEEYNRWMDFYKKQGYDNWFRSIIRIYKCKNKQNFNYKNLIKTDFDKFPNRERITIDSIENRVNFYLLDTLMQKRTKNDIINASKKISLEINKPGSMKTSIKEYGKILAEKFPEIFPSEGSAIRFWGQCTNEFWWKPKYLERVLW